jgi:L-Lysine epsilon oxidase N-terminal
VELTSRRAFLQRSSAAAALVALPSVVAAGCGGGGDDDRIVRVAIHPALGVGRVGNSPDAMYFGPEVPGALPRAPQGFKDADGAVARQAARFRIYGLDASGSPVRELTAHDADITWRLTVANAKPAWYAFNTAFDIPDAQPSARRNDTLRGAQRAGLFIVPGERTIRGAGARPVALDGGALLGQRVSLGEAMTDGAYLNRVAGPGWLATGDAAASFDPLSSQGLVTALVLGRAAGEAATAPGEPYGYAGAVERIVAQHLADRLAYYALEDRFSTSPFWARRRPQPQPVGAGRVGR